MIVVGTVSDDQLELIAGYKILNPKDVNIEVINKADEKKIIQTRAKNKK